MVLTRNEFGGLAQGEGLFRKIRIYRKNHRSKFSASKAPKILKTKDFEGKEACFAILWKNLATRKAVSTKNYQMELNFHSVFGNFFNENARKSKFMGM